MGLFSGAISSLLDLFEDFIRTQQKRLLKKISIALALFTGGVFLLNSLALFISEYLEQSLWVGYGIVGGGLILLAFIFWKE